MNIKRIIIATGNEGKVREFKNNLADLEVPVFSIKELGIESNPDETGNTFEENAFIKAQDIPLEDGDVVLADDSGLEVDYMGGRPGVHTSRYLGADTSHDIKMKGILDELSGVEADKRGAHFKTAIAAITSAGDRFLALGQVDGKIAFEMRGNGGFGYDPIFIYDDYNLTGGEITIEEKSRVSHRGKALAKTKSFLAMIKEN